MQAETRSSSMGSDGSALMERFVQAGPVRLQFFEAGEGSLPVVLVHGYRGSGRIWGLVQERLDRARFRSFAISNRGAGDSDRTDAIDDYTADSFASDLYLAMRGLGIGSCVLIGHSLGTSTVARFALDHPEMVKGLVLSNSGRMQGAGLHQGWEDEVRAQFANGDERQDQLLAGAPQGFQDALAADIARNDMVRLLGGRKSMLTVQLRERLSELAMPVLVIGCDRDDIVALEALWDGYQSLPENRRSLHIFHGMGHSPNTQCPDEFTAVLERFINSLE